MNYTELTIGALLLPLVMIAVIFILKRPLPGLKKNPLMSLVVLCLFGTVAMWLAAPASALMGAPAWQAIASAALSVSVSFGILKVERIKNLIT